MITSMRALHLVPLLFLAACTSPAGRETFRCDLSATDSWLTTFPDRLWQSPELPGRTQIVRDASVGQAVSRLQAVSFVALSPVEAERLAGEPPPVPPTSGQS